jgi:predicted nucleotidyltransferase component of viral defense system
VIFSSSEILPIAESTGFRAEVVEKVLKLLRLLNQLNAHPFLKEKWLLKGGSALNLFVFNIPRLSVDIDLNYIGSVEREMMMVERPKFEEAAQAVFSREGFSVRRIPTEHAGGKWRLSYQSYTGSSGNLEVDVNFMLRQPLWENQHLESHLFEGVQAKNIPVVNIHELAAGKLAALLSRRLARDLFDSHQILHRGGLDKKRLRTAFVVYGAMNRKDWRSVSVDDVNFDAKELVQQLAPMLRLDIIPEGESPTEFAQRLVEECRQALSAVLPFTEAERNFLDRLLESGEINPALLTDDEVLQEYIRRQPLLQWKAVNVRKYKGLS